MDLEDVEYGLVVRFPDQSKSFTYGFEAGRVDARMRYGASEHFETVVREENHDLLIALAEDCGWHVAFSPTDVEGYEDARFDTTPPRPALKVVQGGLA